jgi:hypothetical protein
MSGGQNKPVGYTFGRPTKYEPSMCKTIYDGLCQGYSIEACAGLLGVCKETVYTWLKEYPDFLDAKNKGLQQSRLFWEKMAMEGMWSSKESGTFNSSVWIFNMKNRFGWKDRAEADIAALGSFTLKYNLDDDE